MVSFKEAISHEDIHSMEYTQLCSGEELLHLEEPGAAVSLSGKELLYLEGSMNTTVVPWGSQKLMYH